jgi:hypothetical protein
MDHCVYIIRIHEVVCVYVTNKSAKDLSNISQARWVKVLLRIECLKKMREMRQITTYWRCRTVSLYRSSRIFLPIGPIRRFVLLALAFTKAFLHTPLQDFKFLRFCV